MIKLFSEAYDNHDEATDVITSLLDMSQNILTRKKIGASGIKLSSIRAEKATISQRDKLWQMTLKDAAANGMFLVFAFPSGHLLLCSGDNFKDGSTIRRADLEEFEKTGDYVEYGTSYKDLSRKFIVQHATPYVIYADAKEDKEKYQDPRYDYGGYRGQYKSRHGNSWYTPAGRDKSGYVKTTLFKLKRDLYAKYKSGDINKDLYNKFNSARESIQDAFNRLQSTMTLNIRSYDPDYKGKSTDSDLSKQSRAMSYIESALRDYDNLMDNINSSIHHNGIDKYTIASYLTGFDNIKDSIAKANKVIDEIG